MYKAYLAWEEPRRVFTLGALIARAQAEQQAREFYNAGLRLSFQNCRNLGHAVARYLFDLQDNRYQPVEE